MKTILVTGGLGFIGYNLINQLLKYEYRVINLDKQTYASNILAPENATELNYRFDKVDLVDSDAIRSVLESSRPSAIMHLAAESHVDRSIQAPLNFLRSNIIGTFNLLAETRHYIDKQKESTRRTFRFIHVSTDEVYGELGSEGSFNENSPYSPNSPYSASKASSDHLVRAWNKTYGFPAIITNCSNNFGPYQYPEKLIPVVINRAIEGKSIPVYGRGENIRDWLYVEDHVNALIRVLELGTIGETYCIGSGREMRNIDLVGNICRILDEIRPGLASYKEQIAYVRDRLGHDYRYSVDSRKIKAKLGWSPVHSFDAALKKTVSWYLDNKDWSNKTLNKKESVMEI